MTSTGPATVSALETDSGSAASNTTGVTSSIQPKSPSRSGLRLATVT